MSQIKCPNCQYVGKPKTFTKGSILVEIVLWLCFIVPGLIYSLWRLSTRYDGCPNCKYVNVFPYKPETK